MWLRRVVFAALPGILVTAGILVVVIAGHAALGFAGLALVLAGFYVWKRRDDARAMLRRRSVQGEDGHVAYDGAVTSLYAQEQPCLVFLNSELAGSTHPLSSGATLIGSSPECDITLSGRGLSQRHARIDFDPGKGTLVADLGSADGTWVEGERVETRLLRSGDEVRLGTGLAVRFEFRKKCRSQILPGDRSGGMRKVSG